MKISRTMANWLHIIAHSPSKASESIFDLFYRIILPEALGESEKCFAIYDFRVLQIFSHALFLKTHFNVKTIVLLRALNIKNASTSFYTLFLRVRNNYSHFSIVKIR